MGNSWRARKATLLVLGMTPLAACSSAPELPETEQAAQSAEAPLYRIGAGDTLQIVVWRQEDLSTGVSVRPDGRITMPLIDDMQASGKTPTELAKDLEKALAAYVQDPLVTVVVSGFVGTFQQQVRVVGAAANPAAIPYRANMTLLDVMISVGGLAPSAAGDRAKLVRVIDGEQREFSVQLDSLLREGEISANARVMPGDILIIPESFL